MHLDIDRSTRVLVVISYPRVAAWLGSAVVHWKRKNIDKRQGRECGLYDGVWSLVVTYSLTELKNCWSLCQSFRLYLGVHRQRTSGKWTHRTRCSLGWYPRRSQTCKNQLSVQHLWERRRISSEHEELVWENNGSITLLIFHFHFAGIWAILITSPHFPA